MESLGIGKVFLFLLVASKNTHQDLDNAKIRDLEFTESSDKHMNIMNQPLQEKRRKYILQDMICLKGKSRFLSP